MKKPAKPKPKRRGRPQQAAKRPQAVSLAARAPSHPRYPMAAVRAIALPGWLRGGERDEQVALALLMLPVVFVALWLSLSHPRKTENWIGDVAIHAPVEISRPVVSQPASTPRADAPLPAMPKAAPVAPVEIAVAPVPVSPPAVPSVDAIRPRADAASNPVVPPDMTQLIPVPAPPVAAPARTAALDPAPSMALNTPAERPASLAPAPASPSLAPPSLAGPSGEQFCSATADKLASFSSVGRFAKARLKPRLIGVDGGTFGRKLADAALAQTRDLVIYSAQYQPMAYPMGDVVALQGACIDVVIRAYRELGIDLQEEVQRGRPVRGDTNIDHRRTENMRRFFERNGAGLPVTAFPEDYKPGDIVTYHRPFSRVSTSHIAVVTGVLAPTGRPMIVHNRGYGAQLEDALFVDRITGHYRYSGPPATANAGPSATGDLHPLVRASLPGANAIRARAERAGAPHAVR